MVAETETMRETKTDTEKKHGQPLTVACGCQDHKTKRLKTKRPKDKETKCKLT